jgi:short-subunit dehydrogenase
MSLKEKYGTTALIAGASEGMGAAFATYLASEGMDLVLIARSAERLQQFADSLKDTYKTNVLCIVCDLGSTDAVMHVEKGLNGREPDLLVYNAALSHIGPFLENSLDNHIQGTRVNMITPLQMIHHFGSKMTAKGKGAVILMNSLAGFQGSGYLSVYAATKAFGRILAESLWYEWKKSGVDIIACCAGATATPNFRRTNPAKSSFFAPAVQTPEEVADECFRMLGKKPSYITGRGNRIASYIMHRILPRRMAVNIMGDNTRKMYRL